MSNIELIGTALAKGILKYFDIPFQETDTNIRSDINLLQIVPPDTVEDVGNLILDIYDGADPLTILLDVCVFS